MDCFFRTLEEHWFGVLLFIFICYCATRVIIFFCRLFKIGKYKDNEEKPKDTIGYYFISWLAGLFNDFKHLLALIVIIMFFVVVFLSLKGGDGDSIKDRIDAAKTMIASLVGLVGSIVGYYFGESAGKKKAQPPSTDGPPKVPTKPKPSNPINPIISSQLQPNPTVQGTEKEIKPPDLPTID